MPQKSLETQLPSLDLADYARTPNLDTPSLTTLGRQLLAAVPKRMTAALLGSRDYLEGVLQVVEAAYGEHLKAPAATDGRPVDMAADASFRCLFGRLDSLAQLPVDRYAAAKRAAALRDRLFPTGCSFLLLEYGAQWAEAEQRLAAIEREHLKADIDALCGPEVLAEVRRCHAEYAAMVGVSKAKAKRVKLPDLRALRLQLQQAISAHSVQLVAHALAGGSAGLEAVQPSLDVIDAYREKAAAGTPAGKELMRDGGKDAGKDAGKDGAHAPNP